MRSHDLSNHLRCGQPEPRWRSERSVSWSHPLMLSCCSWWQCCVILCRPLSVTAYGVQQYHICIYACMHIHTHSCMCTHACAHTHTHARAHIQHAHTRTHTHAHTRMRTHTHTYTHTQACAHTHAHTHMHTHAHTRMRTHTHTHTCTHTLKANSGYHRAQKHDSGKIWQIWQITSNLSKFSYQTFLS